MYWPISAPRVYASRSLIFDRRHANGSDGAPEDSPGLEASATGTEINEVKGVQSDLSAPLSPLTPGITPVDVATQRRQSTRSFSGSAEKVSEVAIDRAARESLIALKLARQGHIFAVITATSLTIWQAKPTVILATVVRSSSSLSTYGSNLSLLIRPDAAIFVVQTTLGYLITYSLASDPEARVYQANFPENSSASVRRQSNFTSFRGQADSLLRGPGEGGGAREVSLRFRMVIKIDAGIATALALDDDIVVATAKPAAAQCIRWTPDESGSQTSTELFRKMGWLPKDASVVDMIHDRPMNLYTWITSQGEAYAVQRMSKLESQKIQDPAPAVSSGQQKTSSNKLFKGYCFHKPKDSKDTAHTAAINARFSLVAVGCADGSVHVYNAKDYVGNIPLSHSHRPSVSTASSGRLTFLSYSPDGYCLFVGYESGWAMWSVFGKAGATSFNMDESLASSDNEKWLGGVKTGVWLGGGSEILLMGLDDDRLWLLEMARSAVTGCPTAPNISRTVLQTSTGAMLYQGYEVPDLISISADANLWHQTSVPPSYLVNQWPLRCMAVSFDGRYLAVAGRRGLTHYSVHSGRWKTFTDYTSENEFQVRGGMCWYGHILVAAVEAENTFEARLYSRESALDSRSIVHSEVFTAPIVLMSLTGQNSLLIYTQENILYHYMFVTTTGPVTLVQLGQIAFHGIVRSPARVRCLSWILPDQQTHDGDPSQDVAVATILFLVDGKLVLLQPSVSNAQKLKYDMRVIAHNVEYYFLSRDKPSPGLHQTLSSASSEHDTDIPYNITEELGDSLWFFDGTDIKVWTDVQDILQSTSLDHGKDLANVVSVATDFYPLSTLLRKGTILGIEPDLVQRKDIGFFFFRFTIRTQLYIVPILKFYLANYDTPSALHLSHRYQHLAYFGHALEMLLHDVLDEEVDAAPGPEKALLPSVISFLSSFPQYLDIIVQCTRKTEVKSWQTLFTYLPPPAELFEESLERGALKTAGGYLLVLHTLEDMSSSSDQLVRLFRRATDEGDWDICMELARFLVALDESGTTLKEVLALVDLKHPQEDGGKTTLTFDKPSLQVPLPHRPGPKRSATNGTHSSRSSSGGHSPTAVNGTEKAGHSDGSYFSSTGL